MACLNHSTTSVKNATNPYENHMYSLSKKDNTPLNSIFFYAID